LVEMFRTLLSSASDPPKRPSGCDWSERIFEMAQRKYYLAARDVTTMWVALTPSVHAEDFQQVPALALQFYNDAVFLRTHILDLALNVTQALRVTVGKNALLIDLSAPVRLAGEAQLFATLARCRSRLEGHTKGISPKATVN